MAEQNRNRNQDRNDQSRQTAGQEQGNKPGEQKEGNRDDQSGQGTVEEAKGTETELDWVESMQFDRFGQPHQDGKRDRNRQGTGRDNDNPGSTPSDGESGDRSKTGSSQQKNR